MGEAIMKRSYWDTNPDDDLAPKRPCLEEQLVQVGLKRFREEECSNELFPCQSASEVSGTKRRRTRSDVEDSLLISCSERVVRWLIEKGRCHPLPRTRAALENSVKDMCRARYQVDTNVIYIHLLLNDVVRRNERGEVQVNLDNTSMELRGFVPSGMDGVERFSREFSRALTRAVQWVRSNRSLPSTERGLLKSLEQLCSIQVNVKPSDIVTVLQNHEYIRFEPPRWDIDHMTEERVEYNLPHEIYLKYLTHYMPL